jgi:hypothetical protein
VASERKLFAPPRPSATTTTVYATHSDPQVTQAGRPATAAKRATSSKRPTTKKSTKKSTRKKRTSSTTRR